jgi:hypothetical protein
MHAGRHVSTDWWETGNYDDTYECGVDDGYTQMAVQLLLLLAEDNPDEPLDKLT